MKYVVCRAIDYDGMKLFPGEEVMPFEIWKPTLDSYCALFLRQNGEEIALLPDEIKIITEKCEICHNPNSEVYYVIGESRPLGPTLTTHELCPECSLLLAECGYKYMRDMPIPRAIASS